jgi:hypothetical protein
MQLIYLFKQHHKRFWGYVRSDKWITTLFVVNLVVVIFMVAFPIWKLLPVVANDPFIPLHYNIYLGIDKFGHWYEIFILPAIGLIFLIVNTFLAMQFSRYNEDLLNSRYVEPLLEKMFLFVSPIIELVLLMSMFFILLLNI